MLPRSQIILLTALVASFLASLASGRINLYFLDVTVGIGINIILATSLNLINGFTGQFSLGHAGFMAVGAYAAADLTTNFGPTLLPFFGGQRWLLFPVALLVGGILAALAGLLVGVPYLLSDKPPRIDGKRLELQFELRAPATVQIPDQPDGYSIRVSLYTDNRQSRFAFIDWSAITKDAEHITIPGNVPLLTHNKTRSLLASIGNEPAGSQFIELKIPPSPTKQDETWSEWIFATQRADLSPVPEPDRFAARFRVRSAD